MKRKGAEGSGVLYRLSPAANEEFTAMVNALDRLSRPHSGWDPYEVWRTRVKGSANLLWERDRAPSRWLLRARAAGAAVARNLSRRSSGSGRQAGPA
jgi:hypothetical protein